MVPAETIGDSHIKAVEELKRQWSEIDARANQSTLTRDVGRGRALAEAEAVGLSQGKIGEALQINRIVVCHLLRYHRFNVYAQQAVLANASTAITEGRFRHYWVQLSHGKSGAWQFSKDPVKAEAKRRKLEAERNEYEHKIFDQVLMLIQEGKPPLKRPAHLSRGTIKKRPAASDKNTSWRKAYRAYIEERKTFYKANIEPHLNELIELKKAVHPMHSQPGMIAARCEKVDKEIKRFFRMAGKEVSRF